MTRLAIIGAGMMGEALATGLINSGWSPDDIVFANHVRERVELMASSLGCKTTMDEREAAASAEGTLLAVKPQDAMTALRELSGAIGPAGLVSIVAGLRTAKIEDALGEDASVVRAMPNTPARVGKGATALAAGSAAVDATRELAAAVFAAVGPVVWLDEAQLDAVTALSGSGPAYVFLLAEAIVDAATSMGLPADVAATLAFETIEGAGRMLTQTGTDPATLRAQVTSKGGTTEAAIAVFEDAGLRKIVAEAMEAAKRRSKELGG